MAMRQKQAQLNIRATELQKEKLAFAAKLKSMNLSQFILTQSLEAADELIADQSKVSLSSEGYDVFIRHLEEPPKNLPGLKQLFDAPSVLEK